MKVLFEALRAEGVSPIEHGYAGITGLSAEQRLLLAGLEHVSSAAKAPAGEDPVDPDTPVLDAADTPGPGGTGADPSENFAPQRPQAPEGAEFTPGPADEPSLISEDRALTDPFSTAEEILQVDPDTPVLGAADTTGPAGIRTDPSEDSAPQVPGAPEGAEVTPGPADEPNLITEGPTLTESFGAAEEIPQVDPGPNRLKTGPSETSSEDPSLEQRDPCGAEDATEGTDVGAVAAPPIQDNAAEAKRGSDPDPDAQQSLNPAVVDNLAEVPQPGGVPMMPARASTQGDATVTPMETVKKTVYLKNARMNEPYVGLIEVPGLRGLRLLYDGGTGLLLDEDTGTLSGQLTVSGDFIVRFQGLLAGRRCDLLANLAVIPDLRSLWISKPHDPTAPFAKDDEDAGISRGDLLCVAASKRGRSHAREGLFRDDDFALWTGGVGGWNIAVVADGAGSAKYSRRGSQIAVRTIVRDLPQLLDEHLTGQVDGLVAEHLKGVEGSDGRIKTQLYLSLATAAFNAAKAIGDEAAKVDERAAAFSTTLVLSVARKGPHGWFIAGFAIGDGGAAIFDLPSRTVVPLSLADSGEFAGQTRFLQKSEFAAGYEEVAKRVFFDIRDSFTAVLAMTDGITDPKFPTDSAFASSDVWSSFWETDLSQSVLLSRDNPALERELLAWLDFWSPGNHDDRTIAIMLS